MQKNKRTMSLFKTFSFIVSFLTLGLLSLNTNSLNESTNVNLNVNFRENALKLENNVTKDSSYEKLIIGMECAYQPFNFTVNTPNEYTLPISGTNGEYVDGYDISVAKYLSETLNKPVEVKRIVWDSLIPSLNSGEINMVLAGMSDTPERQKEIDFSIPYLVYVCSF